MFVLGKQPRERVHRLVGEIRIRDLVGDAAAFTGVEERDATIAVDREPVRVHAVRGREVVVHAVHHGRHPFGFSASAKSSL